MPAFLDANVPITINTDGPYLLSTNVQQEFELLLKNGILTPTEAAACVENARKASFLSIS